jgi:hypothetical protein
MTTIEMLVNNLREREAQEQERERQQDAELYRIRQQREIEKVRRVASATFSAQLLSQLNPTFQASNGNFRPCIRFNANGNTFQLNWGEFLWAEPGRQDYFEGRMSDGHAIQFCPDFKDNDEKLALLIDSFKQKRSLLRSFLGA